MLRVDPEANINQEFMLQHFNLAYIDFSAHPLRLGRREDLNSNGMQAYVEWAQLTDSDLTTAFERARVRRNLALDLPDEPLHYPDDIDWDWNAHGIYAILLGTVAQTGGLHLLIPTTFTGLENHLVIKYGRAGGGEGIQARLRAHRSTGPDGYGYYIPRTQINPLFMVWLPDDGLLHIPERFIRNEANRRGWHHGWLDEEGHQREDLIVIPRDQQPELERMFRALVLCFPL